VLLELPQFAVLKKWLNQQAEHCQSDTVDTWNCVADTMCLSHGVVVHSTDCTLPCHVID